MRRLRGKALIGSAILCLWACAKATDSDLGGGALVPQAGRGGGGGTTAKGGSGGSSSATGGAGGSSAASIAGRTGTGTSGSGTGGSSNGGSGGSGANGGSGNASASGGTGGTTQGQAGDDGIPPDVLKNADVVIYYAANIAAVTSNAVEAHLFFQNKSDDPLDLTHVTVRYWTTPEASYGNLQCYYAVIGKENVSLAFVDDGTDSHVDITFKAGQISPHNTDIRGTEFQMKLDAQGSGMFNQGNDWSFDGALVDVQNPQPNARVTAYLGAKLVWGCEPSHTCAGEGGAGGQGGQGGQAGEGSGGTSAGQGPAGGQGGESPAGQGGI